jgi:hypothetical protein
MMHCSICHGMLLRSGAHSTANGLCSGEPIRATPRKATAALEALRLIRRFYPWRLR